MFVEFYSVNGKFWHSWNLKVILLMMILFNWGLQNTSRICVVTEFQCLNICICTDTQNHLWLTKMTEKMTRFWITHIHTWIQGARLTDSAILNVYIFFLILYSCIFFNLFIWSMVDLQGCVSFRVTAKWFSYAHIYISVLDSFPF